MKKLNKKITKLLALMILTVSFIVVPTRAASNGSATVGMSSSGNATIDSNIVVTMAISNIETTDPEGIGSIGGTIQYDTDYLEYVSSASVTPGISFSFNKASNKFAWVYSGDGIKSNTNLMTFTFKAKKEGNTSVTIQNLQLSDTIPNRLNATAGSTDIKINPYIPKSSNASLQSLGVDGYNLTPSFAKDTLDYTLNVSNDVSEIQVTASAEDQKANISGLGTKSLNVGDNALEVIVTAEDGTTKKYTIHVIRESEDNPPVLDSDATLKSLYIGGYTLNPSFRSDINVYGIRVGEKVGGLNVEAIPNSPKASVEITGNMGWNYGMNQTLITVTAEDGTKNVYTINVDRADPTGKTESKSNDNYLTELYAKGYSFIPEFNKEISNYSITVPFEVNHLDIQYKTSSDKAKVEIRGAENFQVGSMNTITIKVTAEDGSVRIYSLNVTKSMLTSNNELKDLSVENYELSPKFSKDILEYNITVNDKTDSLNIHANAFNENATITITGNKELKAGNNVILVKVKDENGFERIYQINVQKNEAKIMGMGIWQFFMLLFILLGLIAIIILIIIILNRKQKKDKDKSDNPPIIPTSPNAPIIDFKPEINLGSRNGLNDDILYPSESFQKKDDKKVIETIAYDLYDDVVTKDELIDAIQEGMETKNPEKLRMLLKQEELNRLKEEIQEKEEEKWSK